jgi:phosphatidylethanolamine-binding protein (PEBP) family uncharacterized protein
MRDANNCGAHALEKAIQGHILAQAVLIGTYQKRR